MLPTSLPTLLRTLLSNTLGHCLIKKQPFLPKLFTIFYRLKD